MTERNGIWRRWRRLSGSDKGIVFQLVPLLILVDVLLRLFGLRRTRRWLRWVAFGPDDKTSPDADEKARAQRTAALAAVLGEHGPWRIGCLRQALAIEYLLRRRNLPAELHIGTLKNGDGQLQAHAWVELDGVALGQSRPQHQSIPGVDQALH